MTRTIVESKTKTAIIGFDQPFLRDRGTDQPHGPQDIGRGIGTRRFFAGRG